MRRTMELHSIFLFFFFFFFFFLSFTSTAVRTQDAVISKTIVVGTQGQTDFSTIQSAINSVPFGNNNWIKIHVKSGVYREQVNIPVGKGYILIEGEGKESTSIESSAYITADTKSSADLESTATFSTHADNVVIKYINMKNGHTEQTGIMSRALAAFVNGDKTSFHDCSFVSVQDTLCDMSGRHYFINCYIEGAVDYIFGLGQSIYDNCHIYTNSRGRTGPGWITAQGRSNPSQTNGFVFKFCIVSGSGSSYLGRAWGPYSRVVFYRSWMSEVVVPQGWSSWNFKGQEGNLFYGEVDCGGPGSNLNGRVDWEKRLSATDIGWLTSFEFIDQEGWLELQP